MKKIITFLLSLLFCVYLPSTVYANDEIKTSAKSAVLISVDTGEILYSNNENERLLPASVTKVMSILLFVEAIDNGNIKLTDKVTTSQNAMEKGGSQIWLEVGETMTVEELLKAVIVASANDACTALGEFVGGSEMGFVKMMNDRAKELGLKNTNFENCTGLDDDVKNHYSSAYDLAVISKEVIKHKIVTKYSTIWLDSLRNGKTELNNTNKLINKYDGITGLKTGTTSEAGFCLSATATRDSMSLCAVVLGEKTSDERFDDAKLLLDYGFANYSLVTPKIDSKKIANVTVKDGTVSQIKPEFSVNSILVKNGSNELEYKYTIKKEITAPIKSGTNVGKIRVLSDNKEVGTIELVCKEKVQKKTFKYVFWKIFNAIGT